MKKQRNWKLKRVWFKDGRVYRNRNIGNRTKKGRHGEYYYIRDKKGKQRYYKIKQEKTGQRRGVDDYIKKINRRMSLNKIIAKGIAERELKRTRGLTYKEIRNEYKELLKNLVLDKDLLDIVTLPENINKFKFRLKSEIKLYDNESNEIGIIEGYGKTIEETIRDIEEMRENGITRDNLMNMRSKGYKTNVTSPSGTIIERIKIKIKYVKGK